MDKIRFEAVAAEYGKRFNTILNRIWPTIKDNGFNEQNQTANYLAAYSKIADERHEIISTWFEFQIPNEEKKNNRIDGLIVNHTSKSVYLVEAKRFSQNTVNKMREKLGEDICRILDLDLEERFDTASEEEPRVFEKGKESIQDYTVYGVALFDLWTYAENHKSEWETKRLWMQFCEEHDIDALSEFFCLEEKTKDRMELAKESFLSTIREAKRYDSSVYHLGVFAFQMKKPTHTAEGRGSE